MELGKFLDAPLPGERVVIQVRRHAFTFVLEVVRFLLLLAAPLVVAWVARAYLPEQWNLFFNGGLRELVIKMAGSLYYLAVWIFFWMAWIDYYLDVWIVTTERIVAMEQRGLFNRIETDVPLERIEDVTCRVQGIWPTMLRYGDITVETAGEITTGVFHNVPQPYQLADQIMKLSAEWRHTHTTTVAEH